VTVGSVVVESLSEAMESNDPWFSLRREILATAHPPTCNLSLPREVGHEEVDRIERLIRTEVGTTSELRLKPPGILEALVEGELWRVRMFVADCSVGYLTSHIVPNIVISIL
jgi:hypothetical protein